MISLLSLWDLPFREFHTAKKMGFNKINYMSNMLLSNNATPESIHLRIHVERILSVQTVWLILVVVEMALRIFVVFYLVSTERNQEPF